MTITKAHAQELILAEWRALPIADRQTEHQAVMHAMKVKDVYRFRCSGDRYQVIKGWLINDLNRWPRDVPVMGTAPR